MEYGLIFLTIILSIWLFKKAAGTLKPNYLNIISFVFYSMLIFELIGGTLVFFGFNNHYMIKRIIYADTIDKTYYSILYTMLIMPIVIILWNKLLLYKKGEKTEKLYNNKINERVNTKSKVHEENVYYLILVCTIICFISLIYVFYHIGYVPLFKLLDSEFNFNIERIRISRYFTGNVYIKNLIMLLITPMLSYISYVYMKVTRKSKWRKLFVIVTIMSIFALTYNFEKSPIIYFLFYFFIIDIVLGNMKKIKKMFPYLIGCGVLIVLLVRIIMGYNSSIFSISRGPVSRILISQVSSLFLHFDAFGNRIGFLNGGSFPPVFNILFDATEYDVRSGAVVMTTYGKDFIQNGTAGVLNSLFIGEAYANFGIFGVLIAPIIVAIIISSIFCWFLKSKKTPLNIILYVELTRLVIEILQGGVVEWIYNVKAIIFLIFIVGINCSAEILSKIKGKNSKSVSNEKRCIYHVPNYIEKSGSSGSSVRPIKMLNGFKEIGYKVDVIMGYRKERKKQIRDIKKKIKSGIHYDFVYSESSTMPTLLTEKNHLPVFPELDFNFLKFCRNKDIKIGLYYRDIYWRFSQYGNGMNKLKKLFALFMYRYDLFEYEKTLDIFYFQTMPMSKYLPKKYQNMNIKTLPPGAVKDDKIINEKRKYFNSSNSKKINIFYVGGIDYLYDLRPLLRVCKDKEYVNLTICCREKDWKENKTKYEKYLTNRVEIVHESGEKLNKYYKNADLCSIYFPEEEYRNFVLPIKFFEYLGNVCPILATKGTAAGDFVLENDIGFVVGSESELSEILDKIYKDKKILIQKHENMIKILDFNTWQERAKQVVNDLNKI